MQALAPAGGVDSQVQHDEIPRNPPGPEGSNGSGRIRALRTTLAINIARSDAALFSVYSVTC